MSFGTDLKCQVPAIVDYISDGIQQLNQFRNFVRDRSQIEKDYAQKLDNLARKYAPSVKNNNAEQATMGEDAEWAGADSSTANAAWFSIVDQTTRIAKCHYQLVDELNSGIIEVLKATGARKEDARKKHVAFYQKLKAERDKTYAEKDKAKSTYHDACMEIQNVRNKMAKNAGGDQDKYRRQLENVVLECNNKKNTYLLSLSTATAEKEKYFEEDLPILADQLQDLDSTRVLAQQKMYREYIAKMSATIAQVQSHYTDALASVDQIDPRADESMFQGSLDPNEQRELGEHATFAFMPWNGGANAAETAVDTVDSLMIDEPSVIFLNNKLIKDRRQLDILGDELSQNSARMNELETVVNGISDRTSAEYDHARERLAEVTRNIAMLSTQKARVKSEVDLIIHNIGDSGLSAQTHNFKASSFTIPTTCDYCNNTIWGLSKQGMTCKACGLNCHAKCEMKVAPNCSRVKGKIDRYHPSPAPQPSPSATPRSSMTTNNTTSVPTSPNTPRGAATIAVESALKVCALYDYNAQSSDELSITEGEELKIIGSEDDGENGWLKVSRGSHVGFVPANYITFDQSSSPPLSHKSNNDKSNISDEDEVMSNAKTPSPPVQQQQQPVPIQAAPVSPPLDTQSPPPSPPTCDYVTALYDFEAVNNDELNLHEGDKIMVIKKDDSGWWEGTVNGRSGVFPANYVQ
ncbi:hypothetical protein BDB00DRAFT_827311 [Zychaea mexicana]|uniref:uncharacterized protein n=1 Tax=Zychaea mexicana TaxID=64656 RepID=UPI0022FE4F37|nr:uncharacterized protein BDB00DRAFT_827311 [Zychaea mexicana]KAI9492598.1 hypothetical protein BDB00DRAFT_827311 [Zychaea mexicana]